MFNLLYLHQICVDSFNSEIIFRDLNYSRNSYSRYWYDSIIWIQRTYIQIRSSTKIYCHFFFNNKSDSSSKKIVTIPRLEKSLIVSVPILCLFLQVWANSPCKTCCQDCRCARIWYTDTLASTHWTTNWHHWTLAWIWTRARVIIAPSPHWSAITRIWKCCWALVAMPIQIETHTWPCWRIRMPRRRSSTAHTLFWKHTISMVLIWPGNSRPTSQSASARLSVGRSLVFADCWQWQQ